MRPAPGCYTTARVEQGRVRFAVRHVARLARDAERIGLGLLDPERCQRTLDELARTKFADAAGIVRLEAYRDRDGELRLAVTTRALGPERPSWKAIRAPVHHPGPSRFPGAKLTERGALAEAEAAAQHAGVDEALLCDLEGCWVEGARTNLFVVNAGGELVTPPLSRGAVEGIARTLLLERVGGIHERDLEAGEVLDAREIVCVNAVRGARPVVRLDDRPVGEGRPGSWAVRLARALEAD